MTMDCFWFEIESFSTLSWKAIKRELRFGVSNITLKDCFGQVVPYWAFGYFLG
jgi:hypothetical protein